MISIHVKSKTGQFDFVVKPLARFNYVSVVSSSTTRDQQGDILETKKFSGLHASRVRLAKLTIQSTRSY